jgi:hypothetical protein
MPDLKPHRVAMQVFGDLAARRPRFDESPAGRRVAEILHGRIELP